MAEIFGNLRVRGNLTVDGTGGGLNRVESYVATLGDLAFSGADTQFLNFTALDFGTDGNVPSGSMWYLVRGSFPYAQSVADGTVTVTFRMGLNNGAIGDTVVYVTKLSKDSSRPEGIVSFNFIVKPSVNFLLGTSVAVDAGTATFRAGTTTGLACTLSIERII